MSRRYLGGSGGAVQHPSYPPLPKAELAVIRDSGVRNISTQIRTQLLTEGVELPYPEGFRICHQGMECYRAQNGTCRFFHGEFDPQHTVPQSAHNACLFQLCQFEHDHATCGFYHFLKIKKLSNEQLSQMKKAFYGARNFNRVEKARRPIIEMVWSDQVEGYVNVPTRQFEPLTVWNPISKRYDDLAKHVKAALASVVTVPHPVKAPVKASVKPVIKPPVNPAMTPVGKPLVSPPVSPPVPPAVGKPPVVATAKKSVAPWASKHVTQVKAPSAADIATAAAAAVEHFTTTQPQLQPHHPNPGPQGPGPHGPCCDDEPGASLVLGKPSHSEGHCMKGHANCFDHSCGEREGMPLAAMLNLPHDEKHSKRPTAQPTSGQTHTRVIPPAPILSLVVADVKTSVPYNRNANAAGLQNQGSAYQSKANAAGLQTPSAYRKANTAALQAPSTHKAQGEPTKASATNQDMRLLTSLITYVIHHHVVSAIHPPIPWAAAECDYPTFLRRSPIAFQINGETMTLTPTARALADSMMKQHKQ